MSAIPKLRTTVTTDDYRPERWMSDAELLERATISGMGKWVNYRDRARAREELGRRYAEREAQAAAESAAASAGFWSGWSWWDTLAVVGSLALLLVLTWGER